MLLHLGTALYNAAIYLASPFNAKAHKIVVAHSSYFKKLKDDLAPLKGQPIIWFHCASLGEFEQGRPIIEAVKKQHPEYAILLTFFSPSGYEIRKNYSVADLVTYFPLDSPANANKFLALVQPSIAVFIKYEIWPSMIAALHRQSVAVIVASAIFRSSQVYFGPLKRLFLPTLQKVTQYFVQDQASVNLLRSIGITSAAVSGDTRFDRVNDIVNEKKDIPLGKSFSDQSDFCIVAGSTWPEDVTALSEALHNISGTVRLIIAPHEISRKQLCLIQEQFKHKKVVFYSEGGHVEEAQVLVIDNIGMLSSLYQYATVAYVGGGFNTGLHNILEAAVYGIPVVIGPHYEKFLEAKDLVSLGGAISVKNASSLGKVIDNFRNKDDYRKKAGQTCLKYIKQNTGATSVILKSIGQYLALSRK